MVECDRHGLSFGSRCCAHVAAAVDDGRPLATKSFVDRMSDPHYLCPPCSERVEAWLLEYRQGTPVDQEPDYSMTGRCFECLRDLFEASGLGDIVSAAQQAHEERRMVEEARAT